MKLEDIVALMDDRQYSRWGKNAEGETYYRPVKERITSKQLDEHLSGTAAYGAYTHVDVDRTKSHVLVFDMDDHGKKGVAVGPTLTLSSTLSSLGIPHLIFRSGGGWGYHIWIFFEKATHWESLHKFAKDVFAAVDEEKTKYVLVASGNLNHTKFNTKGRATHVEHGIEVLPKGDGQQNIAIPCGRDSVPMRLVQNGAYVELEECSLGDLEIEFVPIPDKVIEAGDLGDEDRDTAFDCFIRAFAVDDYAKWGSAGLALVAAFGKDFKAGDGSSAEWAHNRWLEWTKTSGKFRPGDEDQWAGFKPKKFGPLGFWRIAKQHGYKGPWPGGKKRDTSGFNAEWALMNVNGKVEFLNTKTGNVSNTDSFYLLTKPDEGTRDAWLRSPTRRQFNGYTFASPDYEGDKWNLFRGWPVEPEDGDASLWEKYVVELLCQGDADLAHWVMTFVADAVQEPWSPRPGAGLALRGPQGSGKSFLGKGVKAALGDLALEVTNSARVTQQFNDLLVGKTALLCDEAFFTGSPQQQLMLKNLITADDWTFEPKNRKSFTTPNVFRIIATTNNSHAVAIDNDDRRWTIIESKPACPYSPTSMAAREWWAPYYHLVREHPGRVLRYLTDYRVDKDLIGFPHFTEAKAEDKLTSDPLLQVLVQMVETGACPDDLRGDGRVSSGAIYEAVKERGGRWSTAQSLANDLRKRFGATTARNCIKIKRVEWRADSNGVFAPVVHKRTDMQGLQMPPLTELRSMVSAITEQAHDGPDAWVAFEIDSIDHVEADPNGGDADAVERAFANRKVLDQGKVVDEDIPF